MKHRGGRTSRSPHAESGVSHSLLVRLLGLYPSSWQERYGQELSELMANESVTPLALVAVLWGALDAHLHPHLPTPGVLSLHGERLRLATLSVFGASIGALVAACFFLDAVDDLSFPSLMQNHPELLRPWLVLVAGAVIAGLSLLAGVLPIVLAVVQDAHRRRSATVRLLAIPPLALVLFLGGDALENRWCLAHMPCTGRVDLIFDVFLHALFLIAATVSAGAISLAILHSQIAECLFRWALAPAACGTLGLVMMLVASMLWLAGAHHMAPTDFAQSTITLGFGLLIVLMLVTTLCAARGVLRGLATSGKLRNG